MDIVCIYLENTQRNEVSGIKAAHARGLQRTNPGDPNAKQRVGLELFRIKIAKSHLSMRSTNAAIGNES